MGGALDFGKDGKLYIATGENDTPDKAQQLTNLFGKMLRINKSGTIPTDNPFYPTASGNNRAIWALGLRNPFKFAIQPGTGTIFINDVGEKAWEEINRGAEGANYGWPVHEGVANRSPVRGPHLRLRLRQRPRHHGLLDHWRRLLQPHDCPVPAEYEGDYFFADFCNGWIRRLNPETGEASGFATGLVRPIDLEVSKAGELYYLSRSTSRDSGQDRVRWQPEAVKHYKGPGSRNPGPISCTIQASA